MQKRRKILSLGVCATALAVALVGGTMAYLTDTASDVNVMTLGNVDIEQHEYERVVDENGNYEKTTVTTKSGSAVDSYKVQGFTQAKPLLPATGEITGWDDTSVRWEQLTDELLAVGGQKPLAGLSNVQDKFVLVKNTGKTDAYVRTMIAVEYGSNAKDIIGITTGDFWTWNGIGFIEVDDNNYYLYEAIYKGADGRHDGGILPAGEYTYNSLGQVYLASEATNEDVENLDGNKNGTYDILVFSQAVQIDGFADAQTALDAAFGDITTTNHPWAENAPEFPVAVDTADELAKALADGESVYLADDVEATTTATGYGQADIKVNGGVLNGNGKTLSVNGSGDYAAIATTGGTIENLAIDDGFRGIFLENMTEDVYLDNVKLGGDGVCYCINTGSNTGEYKLVVTNSEINGWTSFAQIKSASFANCKFGQGGLYSDEKGRLLKPYVNTAVTDCSFISGFYLDLSSLGEGCKVVLDGCTVNGTALTANICTTESYENSCTFFVELPRDGRTLADCVIFE